MLSKWREENVRCPERVRDIWLNVDGLDRYLGGEKWPVLEQVCIAAIDLQDLQLIKGCLEELDKRFPGSQRVKRLKTMAKLEMRGRYADAERVYEDMLRHDPTNSVIHKRRIAVRLAQGHRSDAIVLLIEYLKKFMSDQEGWLELSALYIAEQEYSRAAFCMEELILQNAHNHLYYQRYAEIQYTIGTQESLELARTYFAHAIKLNPTNLRALYGFLMTTQNLAGHPKNSSQKRKENLKMAAWAAERIRQHYAEEEAASGPEAAAGDGEGGMGGGETNLKEMFSLLQIGSPAQAANNGSN